MAKKKAPSRRTPRSTAPRRNAARSASATPDDPVTADDLRVKEVLTRLAEFRLALYDASGEPTENSTPDERTENTSARPDKTQIIGIDDQIKDFIESVFTARYLFCAMRRTARNNLASAMRELRPKMVRSNAYKVLADLGFGNDADKFRRCRTMVAVIREGDLCDKLEVLDDEYLRWRQDRGERATPSLFEILGISRPSAPQRPCRPTAECSTIGENALAEAVLEPEPVLV